MVCSDPQHIDLHIHSNASDGSLSPREILNQALQLGLAAVSITDHDTVAGSVAAIEGGIPSGLAFLTGIEISAAPPAGYSARGSFHILGYGIELRSPQLNKTLDVLQQARSNRNPQIIARLRDMGIPISLEAVQAEFGGEGQLGRPHIAQLMVQEGWVASFNEAFDRFLGAGKPAYVDKHRVPCADALAIIRLAGGLPVLAHPGLLKINRGVAFETMLDSLQEMGMRGLEVYYPEHSPELIGYYADCAARRGLLKTGGTDFHGTLKPGVGMGFGRGDFFVPVALYEALARCLPLSASPR